MYEDAEGQPRQVHFPRASAAFRPSVFLPEEYELAGGDQAGAEHGPRTATLVEGLERPFAWTRARRARVAVLSTWHPEPVDNGRKQRTRQMINALAEEYDVALISLLPSEEIAAGEPPPVPGVWQQWALPLPVFAPRSWPALIAGLHPLPRSTVMTWRKATALRIAHLLQQAQVELAIGTDLRTLRYLLTLDPQISTILDEPDVSPFTVEADAHAHGLARVRAISRRRKYQRLLHRAAQRLDAVVVASTAEARAYRELSGASRVTLIENGVASLPEPPWRVSDSAQLLFNGALSYAPNAEAVAYFVRAILPRIEVAAPEVRLLVTGAAPAILPPGTEHLRVELTDWLSQREFEAVCRSARACVVPLRSGTGTRIKLLEALALGMPVVTTTKGAEGLSLIPDEHLLIADDPESFAAATIRLLTDPAFAAALGTRGRERVRERYDWSMRGEELRTLVRACLQSPAWSPGGR